MRSGRGSSAPYHFLVQKIKYRGGTLAASFIRGQA
jgi:hypothetical protein